MRHCFTTTAGLLFSTAIVAVGLTACGGGAPATSDPSPAAGAKSTTVTIKNFAFTPATVRARPGTTVTWTNTDSTAHTTTADKVGAETWDSGSLAQNHSYSIVFTAPGTYTFHCSIHDYMTGTITVTG